MTSTSFEYKTKLIGSTPDYNNILAAEVVVPLKNLSIWVIFGDHLICRWLTVKYNLVCHGQKNV